MDSFSSEDPRDTETSTTASASDVGFLPLAIGPNTSIEEGAQEDPPPLGLLPEVFHLAEGSFVEQPGWRNLGVESLDLPRGSPFCNHEIPGGQEGHDEAETEDGVDGPGVPLERPLQDVLDLLRSTDSAPPQLRELEYQVLSFRDRLKVRLFFAGWKSCFADGVTTGSEILGQGAWASILASPLCNAGGRCLLSGPQSLHQSNGYNNGSQRPGRRIIRGSRGSVWITCSTSSQIPAPSHIF